MEIKHFRYELQAFCPAKYPEFTRIRQFTSPSFYLCFACGLIEVIARFKVYQEPIKVLMRKIEEQKPIALSRAGEYYKYVENFYEIIRIMHEDAKTTEQAFAYLKYFIDGEKSESGLNLKMGMKYFLASLFRDEKIDKINDIIRETDPRKIETWLLLWTAECLSIQITVYSERDKNLYENQKLGLYPIISIYNNIETYCLLYTEVMIENEVSLTLNASELQRHPFVYNSQGNRHAPKIDQNPTPVQMIRKIMSIPKERDYITLSRIVIDKLAEDLVRNNCCSTETSELVRELCDLNQELASINSLRSLKNTIPKPKPDSLIPGVFRGASESTIISSDEMIVCQKCRITKERKHFVTFLCYITCKICDKCRSISNNMRCDCGRAYEYNQIAYLERISAQF